MELIKWKLVIKKINDIERIIIYTLNQNNLIYLKEDNTEIYFYTLKSQKEVLLQIDDNIFSIDLLNNKHNYEINNIVKAILFYDKIDIIKYSSDKQNFIKDRYIYSRKYNTLIPEYRYGIFYLILRDVLNNTYFGSNYIASFLTYLMGYFLKSNFSSLLVNSFIKNYHINKNKYIIKGPSFNDFFIRELKEQLPIIKNNDIIYSPATSRSMVYNYKNFYKLKLYIKGKYFSLSKLIDEKQINHKYSVILCRLAINDYHHIHMPEDGTLVKIKEFNGTYISVAKEYINSNINVLNDNKRVLLKFKRNDGTYFYLVLVGSIVVASIKYQLELNKKYLTKQKIAYFELGGSCVVYVSDKNIYFDEDIIYYTNEEIETYMKAGEEIGNINNARKILYLKNYAIKKHVYGFINNLIEIIINFIIKINNKLLKNIEII